MRAGRSWGLRLGMLAALVSLLAGCGAQRASGSQGGATATGAAATECPPASSKAARFREMTWNEYYADVRERAWRNNAVVIWITPPKVKKKPAPTADATACAR